MISSENGLKSGNGAAMAGMPVPDLEARMSMVDGFPYKEGAGGSNPSVPTIYKVATTGKVIVRRGTIKN